MNEGACTFPCMHEYLIRGQDRRISGYQAKNRSNYLTLYFKHQTPLFFLFSCYSSWIFKMLSCMHACIYNNQINMWKAQKNSFVFHINLISILLILIPHSFMLLLLVSLTSFLFSSLALSVLTLFWMWLFSYLRNCLKLLCKHLVQFRRHVCMCLCVFCFLLF